MSKLFLRTAVFGILLVSLAALPATSQVVPAGPDFWVTPANGQTFFTFPEGDVETLCGAPPSNLWNHQVALEGVPVAGTDYDTVVKRLQDAVFDPSGVAHTRIQLAHLDLTGSSWGTPCGDITWRASASGPQRVTTMTIRRTSGKGGIFNAQIAVDAEFKAHDSAGNYLGSLFYAFDLPDPTTTGSGTPWSFGPDGQFRAGMTELDNCIAVLRQKLTKFPTNSSHYYFISDMIAQGKCERTN